jgi:hypothetical protein
VRQALSGAGSLGILIRIGEILRVEGNRMRRFFLCVAIPLWQRVSTEIDFHFQVMHTPTKFQVRMFY